MATKKTTTTTVKATPKATPAFDLSVFNIDVKSELITQAIYIYQANSHQHTSKVLTRGEMGRTTHKVYKQKHTGNARHGARSAPIYVGGGVAHGPKGIKPALKKLNQKMKVLALGGMLSRYCKDKLVQVVDTSSSSSYSTKDSIKLLPTIAKGSVLVHSQENPKLIKSVANLELLKLVSANRLNAFDIASSRQLILTDKAYQVLVNRLKSVL